MKLRFKEYKSDIIWKNYQRLILVMDRTVPSTEEWKELNKIGWELIGKYIDELQKEFMK